LCFKAGDFNFDASRDLFLYELGSLVHKVIKFCYCHFFQVTDIHKFLLLAHVEMTVVVVHGSTGGSGKVRNAESNLRNEKCGILMRNGGLNAERSLYCCRFTCRQ